MTCLINATHPKWSPFPPSKLVACKRTNANTGKGRRYLARPRCEAGVWEGRRQTPSQTQVQSRCVGSCPVLSVIRELQMTPTVTHSPHPAGWPRSRAATAPWLASLAPEQGWHEGRQCSHTTGGVAESADGTGALAAVQPCGQAVQSWERARRPLRGRGSRVSSAAVMADSIVASARGVATAAGGVVVSAAAERLCCPTGYSCWNTVCGYIMWYSHADWPYSGFS